MDRLCTLLAAAVLAAFVTAGSAQAQIRVEGEPVRLTDSDRSYTAPEWSPDGSRIAVAGDGYAGLYVVDLESGGVRTITDNPGAGYGFAWAPDGSSLLSRVARFDGPRRTDAVVVFDAETGTAEQLTEFRSDLSALPHWDDSGGRVFLFVNERLEIFTRPTGIAPKADDAERPEWVATQAGLAAVRLGLEEVRTIHPLDEQIILNLTPSPDGTSVVFEVLGGNMFVADAEGSGIIDLGPGNRPSWSPDGEWITYMLTEDDGHTFTRSDLYAIRVDGSEQTQLTDTPDRLEMNPSWSPDGSRIAFDDLTNGSIYLLPVSR